MYHQGGGEILSQVRSGQIRVVSGSSMGKIPKPKSSREGGCLGESEGCNGESIEAFCYRTKQYMTASSQVFAPFRPPAVNALASLIFKARASHG